MSLPPGEHAYKFIVDNEWRFASDQSTVIDKQGNINNYIDLANFKPDEFLIKSQSMLGSWDAPPPLPPRRGGRPRRRRAKRKQQVVTSSSRLQREDESSTSSPDTNVDDSSDSQSSRGSQRSGQSDSDTELRPSGAAVGSQPAHAAGLSIRTRNGASSSAASHRRRRRHVAIGLADRVPVYDPEGGLSSSTEDEGGHEYGTSVPSEDKYTKEPPGIAPHLRAMPLNHDFPATPTGHKLLPIPSHVGVGHLFCTAVKGDLTVHGITTRYKRKFTTMVFYSPQTVRGNEVLKLARGGHAALEGGNAPRKASGTSMSSTGTAMAGTASSVPQPAAPPLAPDAGGTQHAPAVPGAGAAATDPAASAAASTDTHVVVQTTSGPLTVRLTVAHRQAIDEQRATAQQRLSAHRESLRSSVAAGQMTRQNAEELARQAQMQAEEWLAMAQNQVLQAALVAQYAAEQPAAAGGHTQASQGTQGQS